MPPLCLPSCFTTNISATGRTPEPARAPTEDEQCTQQVIHHNPPSPQTPTTASPAPPPSPKDETEVVQKGKRDEKENVQEGKRVFREDCMSGPMTRSYGVDRCPLPSSKDEKEHVQKGKRVAIASPEEIHPPPTACPTLLIFLISLIAYVTPIITTWRKPRWWTIPISTIANYLLFTPMHDSAHRSVSVKHRWLNEMVGYICGMMFLSPFRAFRYIHLEHHKHTNDPHKDPDHWSASSQSGWLQPLFWCTQSGYYYVHYLTNMMQRPVDEVFEVALTLLALVYAFIYALCRGWESKLMYFVFIPRFLAETFLAYSFDYAPHRPHHVTREEDIYACTSMLEGLLDPKDGVDLSLPLLFQNYHNIHHLYPMIPWYQYATIWLNHRQQLRELGTPITNWLGFLKVA